MSAAGKAFISPHAVNRYRERVEAVSYEVALGAIIRAMECPRRVYGTGSVRTYDCGRWRVLVRLPNRRRVGQLPVAFTVVVT